MSDVRKAARMSEEARERAAENIGLAYNFAARAMRARRRFGLENDPEAEDEIHSAAHLGLCKAAMSFDRGRGIAFSTYAFACMKYELCRALSRLRRRSRTAMFSDLIAADRDEEFDPPDRLAEPVDAGLVRESERERLDACLGALNPREQYVVRRHCIDGATLERIGAELAEAEGRSAPLSRERVRQLAARALNRISAALMENLSLPPKGPDDPIPLGQIAAYLPRNRDGQGYSMCSINEWIRLKGKGPRLRTLKLGRQRYTTPRDVQGFIGARWPEHDPLNN